MFTNRTRSNIQFSPVRSVINEETVEFKRDNGSGFCTGSFDTRTSRLIETLYPIRFSAGTIQDFVVEPKVKHKFVRRNIFSGLPRAVKDVRHTKVTLDSFREGQSKSKIPGQEDITIVQAKDLTDSLCLHEKTVTTTCPPLAFLCARFGPEYVRENILEQLPRDNANVAAWQDVNWAELDDQFDEASKSLIPSSFFSGESIAEGGIFIDAVKLVVQPKKTIVNFIKDVRKRRLGHLNLGALSEYYRKLNKGSRLRSDSTAIEDLNRARKLLSDRGVSGKLSRIENERLIRSGIKEGINSHLSYQFGVKPAIHDIKDAIAAHTEVEGRLEFLNKHRGQYVPIRAKKKYNASFEPGSITPTPYLDFQPVLRDCFTVGCVFGMGRIRTDIHEASRWRAYAEYFGLNKVVGTAWELIPFSFVFDWFTNAQEAINKLTRIPLGESPFMNLAAVGHSFNNIARYEYMCIPGYDQVTGYPSMEPGDPFPCFGYTVTDYTRVSGFPSTSLFANLSNFGLFHGITGGELLLQKKL
jgi:hypothetical protein